MLFSNFEKRKRNLTTDSPLSRREREMEIIFSSFKRRKRILNPPQIASLRGCIVTLVAFVCLFSTVCLQMSPQIACPRRCENYSKCTFLHCACSNVDSKSLDPSRQSHTEDLNTSPLLQSTREEACHNCGGIFTSEHQCDDTRSETENENIIEEQNSVIEVARCNGDGSAPERCQIKNCGMAFTANTRRNAFRIKNTHENDHIFYPLRFEDPKEYFEEFKLELANPINSDCKAEIFMSD